MHKWLFWFICGLIIVTGLGTAGWFIREGWPDRCYYAAPVIGSLLVAVGWMVTSLNTIASAERDNTLKLLATFGTDKESIERWGTIYKFLPEDDDILKLPGEESPYASDDHPLYSAVRSELNYYEYIAIGALKGVYDDTLLRSELYPSVAKLYALSGPFIEYTRTEDNDDQIWICFIKLCKRWGIARRIPAATGGQQTNDVNPYSMFANYSE